MTPSELSKIFRENVDRILKEKNISQKYVAGKMGVTPPVISKMINENTNPTQDTLAKIASALDVHPWELLKPQDESSTPGHSIKDCMDAIKKFVISKS